MPPFRSRDLLTNIKRYVSALLFETTIKEFNYHWFDHAVVSVARFNGIGLLHSLQLAALLVSANIVKKPKKC